MGEQARVAGKAVAVHKVPKGRVLVSQSAAKSTERNTYLQRVLLVS